MKIAVTGKGGVGKTTIAATLARLYAQEGKKVIAADADPDANLALALGFTEEEADAITPISAMKKMIAERTGVNEQNTFYKINPRVDDIPEIYSREHEGVKLLVLGTVETAGGGCICPENVILKQLISNLVLFRDEVAILDMEAGLEHLGIDHGSGERSEIAAASVHSFDNGERIGLSRDQPRRAADFELRCSGNGCPRRLHAAIALCMGDGGFEDRSGGSGEYAVRVLHY